MNGEPNSVTLLERVGLRNTETRRRVLAALLDTDHSLSHTELAGSMADLDRITIFRSLKTLKRAGLLHAVRGVDGVQRYIVNPERAQGCPGGHAHFLCLECGALTCLAGQPMPRVEVPRGAQIRGKQFLVYGICPACAARHRTSPTMAAAEADSK